MLGNQKNRKIFARAKILPALAGFLSVAWPALTKAAETVPAGDMAMSSRLVLGVGVVMGIVLTLLVFSLRRIRDHGRALKGGRHFRDVADFAGDWVWEMDADLRFTYLSARFFELFPIAPENILGKTRSEYSGAAADERIWRDHFQDLGARRPFRDFKYSLKDDDGRSRHLRVSGRPVFGADGEFMGYQGTGTDLTAEVEAAAQAAQAEATLTDAIESITAGFALFDSNDRLVLCNKQYRDSNPVISKMAVPGVRFEDIIRKIADAGLYDEEISKDGDFVEKRLALHRNLPADHEQRLADGRWLNVREYGTHDGGAVLLLTDITERKQAEKALEESEALLRAVLDHLPAAIALKDIEGRYLLTNREFESWMNPEGRDIVGRTTLESFSKDEAERIKSRDREVFEGGKGTVNEVRRMFPDGKVRTTMIYKFPIFGADGEITGIGSINLDISERKKAERALEESEARFRNLVEGSVQGVLIHIDHNPRFVNQAYAEIFGYDSPEELIAEGSAMGHVAPHERDRMRAYTKARIGGDYAPVTYGFEGIRKDGTPIWLENRARAVTWKGKPAVQRTIVDITERKRAEENLREALEAAEIANRAKTEFLANMSHELRTPLNSVIGFSQVIKDSILGPMDNPKYQDYAADIFTSGQHLLVLINDILDVSKIEVGEMDIAEEPVDIGETINFCVRMIKERAERAEIKLSVETAERCPALKADERRLKQILLNLLSNAVKFTPSRGKVSIGADLANGGGIRLWVSDTGIGIAPEDIPRVLKPFAQVESPFYRSYEGTGLGLSLAKSLSEIQGARLEIESEAGKGTTVSVHFPPEKTITAKKNRTA